MPVMHDIAHAHESMAGILAEGLRRVEQRFNEHLNSPIGPVADLCRQVERYRGKMLRPTLVLLSGLTARPRDDHDAPIPGDHITIAAVIEMIHMATLVHDDVLDDATIRRGGRTINDERGNETAVILGDYLIARSFHLCSTLDDQRAALRIGAITAEVCEGEMLEIHHRGDFELTEPTYFDIIERKTASLIGAACELGATHASVGGMSNGAELGRRFFDFGAKLGIAFQIIDDLLDLVGDEQTVGKSVGRDLEQGTLTLPLIRHLSFLSPAERERTIRSLHAPDDASRARLAADLDHTGSIVHARRVAVRYVEEAKALLAPLPDSEAKQTMLAMADAVIHRTS